MMIMLISIPLFLLLLNVILVLITPYIIIILLFLYNQIPYINTRINNNSNSHTNCITDSIFPPDDGDAFINTNANACTNYTHQHLN